MLWVVAPSEKYRSILSEGLLSSLSRQSIRTLVVPDVDKFPGHIACSSRSRSEIVVPLLRSGLVTAVLDIDSDELGTFDAVDAAWLEMIAGVV